MNSNWLCEDGKCGCPQFDKCHPVKEQLTDEDWDKWISLNSSKFYFKVGRNDLRFNAHGFARAILRKAQEND